MNTGTYFEHLYFWTTQPSRSYCSPSSFAGNFTQSKTNVAQVNTVPSERHLERPDKPNSDVPGTVSHSTRNSDECDFAPGCHSICPFAFVFCFLSLSLTRRELEAWCLLKFPSPQVTASVVALLVSFFLFT